MFHRVHPELLLLLALSSALWPPSAGAQWRGDGVPVCTAPNTQLPPRIVSDGAGGAIVAWTDYRSGPLSGYADIYAQRVRASGAVDRAWPTNGRPVCTAPTDQGSLVIISDGAGGAIVAWHDGRDGNADIYAQHVLASGVVDPAWPTDGRALCTAPGPQLFPAMVADGAGGAIVTWDDQRVPNGDLYAQHVLASGVVDPAWPTDGRALCTAPGHQIAPEIVADGAGGAIVAWGDTRSDYGDLYAQHVLASGVVDPAWPVDGLAVCTAYEEQGPVEMIADGAGGALLAWTDARRGFGGYIDVYAQHVLGSGVVDPAWPTDGRAVCAAPEDQYVGGIVPDRAGGAIVAWTDLRSHRFDIYAQHVRASGVADPAWPADGQAICTAPPGGHRSLTGIASDGTGGAIIIWDDYRDPTGSDLYAQHVRASGALDPAWPAEGRVLCAASGDQYNPAIASDGAGRAIVAWYDARGRDGDIYAQRIYTHSAANPKGAGPVDAFTLHSPEPGAARGEIAIRFDLPAAPPATLEVFDAAGRAVRTLVVRQELGAGTHRFIWDGADHAGVPLRRGVYLVRLSAAGRSVTRKFVILE